MPARARLAQTDYGYFDVEGREYVITTPATPTPWVNYLGLEGELCGMISNTAGGPTWYRDAGNCRITRYVHVGTNKDRPGRWLYVRDSETGDFWSATYQPVTHAKPDAYTCRHGLGYTVISSETNGIAAELLHFIPLGEAVEVQRVALRNASGRPRRLSVFPFREFVNGNAGADLTNVQYSGHIGQIDADEDDDRILYLSTVSPGWPVLPFCAISAPMAGFDTACEVFKGDGSVEDPQVVREGRMRGTLAGDDTIVGVYKVDLDLAPGEEYVFHVLVGCAPTRHEIRAVLGRWLGNDERVMGAFGELKEHAVGLLQTFQCEVPDPYTAVMVNTWNAYQCWINFQFSRSVSGYADGIGRSMGTRDSLQDLLGYTHMAPARARTRLLEIMRAVQVRNGQCHHQYSALSKQAYGDVSCSDDHLWSVLAASAYVKETGDAAVLDEQFGYEDAPGEVEDLYGHLLRAVRFTFGDSGPHGLPRLRGSDWNDCFSAGRDNQVAESVLVGMMLAGVAREMVELTRVGGREGLTVEHDGRRMGVIEYLTMVAEAAAEAVNREGWREDGPYYARGTSRTGEWRGVPDAADGKMFLEPQPWSVMTGVADEERGRTAMDSVQRVLATPCGIELVRPAVNLAPYPSGAKENGAIFCHPNPWAVCAECMLGRGDRAYAYYRAILPSAASEADPAHYAAEPYVYGQQRYGRDHREYGKLAGTWLTGTAAWNYVAVSQYILGIRPDWDGLTVDPCVPPDWKRFRVVRKFRGATYDIRVKNPKGVCKGVASVKVDGRRVEGNTLPVFGDGATHAVEVVMG